MLKISLLTFLTVSFTASVSWADCTSPAGPAGAMNWSGSAMEICDGSSWAEISGSTNPSSTCNSYTAPSHNATGSVGVLQWNGSVFSCRTAGIGTTYNSGGGGGGGV